MRCQSLPGKPRKGTQPQKNQVSVKAKPKAARRNREHELQKNVAAMLDQELPLDAWWFPVSASASRNAFEL
jgi:hypothetical protein